MLLGEQIPGTHPAPGSQPVQFCDIREKTIPPAGDVTLVQFHHFRGEFLPPEHPPGGSEHRTKPAHIGGDAHLLQRPLLGGDHHAQHGRPAQRPVRKTPNAYIDLAALVQQDVVLPAGAHLDPLFRAEFPLQFGAHESLDRPMHLNLGYPVDRSGVAGQRQSRAADHNPLHSPLPLTLQIVGVGQHFLGGLDRLGIDLVRPLGDDHADHLVDYFHIRQLQESLRQVT